MSEHTIINWTEAGKACSARWRSESGTAPPKRVVIADDTMKADEAYRLACEGTALLWRGDFQNARQLMLAMSRRADRKPRKPVSSLAEGTSAVAGEAFNLHRQAQSQRARTLAMILVPLDRVSLSRYAVRLICGRHAMRLMVQEANPRWFRCENFWV